MPRPLTPDEHYDNEYERERARRKARQDARNDEHRERESARRHQNVQLFIGAGVIVGGCLLCGFGVLVLQSTGVIPKPTQKDEAGKGGSSEANKRTITDPSLLVKADDLESAYRLGREKAEQKYDGKLHLIFIPVLAAMDEDSESKPCVLHWNDKGAKCPAVVVRLANRNGYAKAEQVSGVYVEGRIVGLKEVSSLPWAKKWANLPPSHMVPDGFVLVVEDGKIVAAP